MTKISKSSISNKSYHIPEILDDSKNINKFISNHPNKKVIVVQGLGFVGSVMSLVCANSLAEDYAVIGIDLPSPESYWKICSINEGIFPVISADKKVEEYFQNTKNKKNLYATYDPYVFSMADIIIVDINLDVQKKTGHIHTDKVVDYSVDISGFKAAIKSIGENCKEDALILIETTVPPGTTVLSSEIVKNHLTERGLKTDKIIIGHSYERVMPGPNYIDSIQNFYRVYSGINKYSADNIETFLKTIISTEEYPLTRLKNTNSTEMSKVLENSFRAMNIAFIVEWSRYAEESGVDLYEVVEAIRMRPTHKNIMLPGIGVGGYCLTKDPLLASWSKQKMFNSDEPLNMSEKAVTTNDKMPLYTFEFLKKCLQEESLKNKEVLLLGVSYAPDVGDTRYTPVELLCKLLIGSKCKIILHDPYVTFWEELKMPVNQDLGTVSENTDIVIVSTGHSFYRGNTLLLKELMKLNQLLILDTIGVFSKEEISELSTKHTVKVLGRGDL